jgi:hypothetical protein
LLLKVFEGSQAVVLLRKPRMQVVHVSLFERLKKLLAYTASPAAAPWRFLHPRPARHEGRHSGTRLLARAMGRNCAPENPYSRWWLWIPGSSLRDAPE